MGLAVKSMQCVNYLFKNWGTPQGRAADHPCKPHQDNQGENIYTSWSHFNFRSRIVKNEFLELSIRRW